MGFLDRIFKTGKAYEDKREPRLVCELSICGERYLLDSFDIELDREKDKRYLPISAVFSGRIAPELEGWIVRSSERRDGMLRFYRNKYDEKNRKADEGAVFDVRFYEALCIGIRREQRGATTTTTLLLSAKRIRVGDEEYQA